MLRVILHVDMDSYYASAEMARDKALQGKPVIIGHDPKGGKGRGVVTACSYEARKFGVKSGIPISKAYRLCTEAVFLRPDFSYYNHLSGEVMDLLREFSSKFEQASIDEAYIDISNKVKDYDDVEPYVRKIKTALKSNFDITCSVGAAVNKSIAKIASDIRKPDGLTIVRPEESMKFLETLPVSKISGVGVKTTEILDKMDIKTIGGLAKTDGKELVKVFGKNGVWLWGIANALERAEVQEIKERKSISHEFTFQEDTNDPGLIEKTLSDLTDKVHRRLKEDGLYFKTVGIKVRYENFATFVRERSTMNYAADKEIIASQVSSLYQELHEKYGKIRLLGVRLSNLRPMGGVQQTLGTWQEDKEKF